MIPVFAFWTVFTVPAVLIAMVGGAAIGFSLGSIFPPNPFIKKHRVFVAFGIIGLIGLLFYAGQLVEVLFGPEPQYWSRLVARAALWVIYSGALALAATWAQDWRFKKP